MAFQFITAKLRDMADVRLRCCKLRRELMPDHNISVGWIYLWICDGCDGSVL